MRCLSAFHLVLFLMLLLPLSRAAEAEEENPFLVGEFKVERVFDGDTIAVRGLKGSIRLLCIDTEECGKEAEAGRNASWTPEGYDHYVRRQQAKNPFAKYDTPLGWAGKEFAEEWFPIGSTVRIEYDALNRKTGFYGRTLGYVFAKRDGEWVNYNVESVRAGMSPYFTKYGRSKRFELVFLQAEREARAHRRGVWSRYAMGYPNYDERIAAWDRRAQAMDLFEHEKAARPEAFAILDEDDWARLPEFVGRTVLLLGTADPAGANILSMSHKNDARLALVFSDAELFRAANRLVAQSPDDFLQVTGILQQGGGPAGEKTAWHVEVSEPVEFMLPPTELQATLFSSEAILYSLAEGEIDWSDAPAQMGNEVIVLGKIIRTNNIGEITFLNFHTNFQETLTLVIEKTNYEKFPEPPEIFYRDKVLRVRGIVSEYDGKPQIVVSDPKQIDVL